MASDAAAAQRYGELFGRSKGVLMKAGQLYGMRDFALVGGDTLLPYQQALRRLQTDAPAMPASLAADVIEADLGRPLGRVFTDFSEDPIAAVSIGQVHEAVLTDGRRVAVKVQYPGAAEAIRADLLNPQLLETFWRYLLGGIGVPMLSMRRAVRDMSARIGEEVDYRHQVANIVAFASLYRDHPFIRIPEVVPEASGDRVLTSTYVEGMDWMQARRHSDQGLKNTWAEAVFRFLLGSWRHGNLMYGDPQPDNCRFSTDGTVTFLDFGCRQVLSERDRWLLVSITRAVVEDRQTDFYRDLPRLGFVESGAEHSADLAIWDWSRSAHGYFLDPQPFIANRHADQHAVHTFFGPDRPALPRIAFPTGFAIASPMAPAVIAIPVALGANIFTRAALDELDGVAEPATDMGKQHVAWVRERGLPFGMDHHKL